MNTVYLGHGVCLLWCGLLLITRFPLATLFINCLHSDDQETHSACSQDSVRLSLCSSTSFNGLSLLGIRGTGVRPHGCTSMAHVWSTSQLPEWNVAHAVKHTFICWTMSLIEGMCTWYLNSFDNVTFGYPCGSSGWCSHVHSAPQKPSSKCRCIEVCIRQVCFTQHGHHVALLALKKLLRLTCLECEVLNRINQLASLVSGWPFLSSYLWHLSTINSDTVQDVAMLACALFEVDRIFWQFLTVASRPSRSTCASTSR